MQFQQLQAEQDTLRAALEAEAKAKAELDAAKQQLNAANQKEY
jgi:hypothetical protein